MCFSPKIKTPKVDTQAMKAVDPAPLTEEPKGVLFGGEDDTDATSTSSEVPSGSSIKASKVKLDDQLVNLRSPRRPMVVSVSQSAIRRSVNDYRP